MMIPEAAILIGHQHLDQSRIDRIEIDLQPPAAIGCRKGAQQGAVSVDDFTRHSRWRIERWRIGAVERKQTLPGADCQTSGEAKPDRELARNPHIRVP